MLENINCKEKKIYIYIILSYAEILHVFVVKMGFPHSSVGKESSCNARDPGSSPGSERSPREGKAHPLQYSGLENSLDCIVHGITKSRTRLSDCATFTCQKK